MEKEVEKAAENIIPPVSDPVLNSEEEKELKELEKELEESELNVKELEELNEQLKPKELSPEEEKELEELSTEKKEFTPEEEKLIAELDEEPDTEAQEKLEKEKKKEKVKIEKEIIKKERKKVKLSKEIRENNKKIKEAKEAIEILNATDDFETLKNLRKSEEEEKIKKNKKNKKTETFNFEQIPTPTSPPINLPNAIPKIKKSQISPPTFSNGPRWKTTGEEQEKGILNAFEMLKHLPRDERVKNSEILESIYYEGKRYFDKRNYDVFEHTDHLLKIQHAISEIRDIDFELGKFPEVEKDVKSLQELLKEYEKIMKKRLAFWKDKKKIKTKKEKTKYIDLDKDIKPPTIRKRKPKEQTNNYYKDKITRKENLKKHNKLKIFLEGSKMDE